MTVKIMMEEKLKKNKYVIAEIFLLFVVFVVALTSIYWHPKIEIKKVEITIKGFSAVIVRVPQWTGKNQEISQLSFGDYVNKHTISYLTLIKHAPCSSVNNKYGVVIFLTEPTDKILYMNILTNQSVNIEGWYIAYMNLTGNVPYCAMSDSFGYVHGKNFLLDSESMDWELPSEKLPDTGNALLLYFNFYASSIDVPINIEVRDYK
jgi:hypothetical protein